MVYVNAHISERLAAMRIIFYFFNVYQLNKVKMVLRFLMWQKENLMYSNHIV